MGWFSKSDNEGSTSKAPTRSSRKQCWESRDSFFSCLDTINVINALDPKYEKDIKVNCKDQEEKFERDCATSWIKYFKEKRVVDFKREKFLKEMEEQNAQRIDLSSVKR